MKDLIQNSVHFILLIVFFIFNAWNNYFELVSLISVIKIITIFFFSFFVLFYCLSKFTGNFLKSGIFTFSFAFLTLFFSLIKNTSNLIAGMELRFQYQVLVLIVCLFFILLVLKLMKGNIKILVNYLSFLLLILVLVEFVKIIVNVSHQKKTEQITFLAENVIHQNIEKLPSVYLIVLDEYAGKTSLKNNYSFSNDVFLDSLKKHDFIVLENTNSNYKYTLLSMNSMFNGEYLKFSHGSESYTHKGYNQALAGLNSNKTTATFQQLGYKIINYSPFLLNEMPPAYKDRFVPSGEMLLLFPSIYDDFSELILPYLARVFNNKKLISFIYSAKSSVYSDLLYKSCLLGEKDSLKPVFCYLHLMMPHGPYVFDETGNYNYDYLLKKTVTQSDNQKAYLQYLVYTNKVILQYINKLKKATDNKAIIILMSDHGSRENSLNKKENEKFDCLNAIYYPGKTSGGWYNGMSNINQFRILFSEISHTSIPLMKDSIISK